MTTAEKTHKLLIQLFPKDSRAFKVPYMSDLWRLLRAMSLGFARAYDAGQNVLDALIPDNANFTADDATAWERRLGLPTNPAVPLADRMAGIYRKMAHPGEQPARQHYLYIQEQLRLAGFDVYVYENRFDDGMGGLETRTPGEVLGITTGTAILGTFELGEVELAETWADDGITIIANKLKAEDDADFAIGANYRSTFFIASDPITDFADVSAARQDEFRELILRLKPVQTVGFLFVNYV